MKPIENSSLSYKGSFFFPDCQEDMVTGILTIEADGAANLELLGAFEQDGLLAKRELRTIWGVLFNGDKVTLLDSYRGQGVYRSGGSEVNYRVGTTILGTHIPNREVSVFNTITAEIDQLQEWLRIDGGQLQFSLDLKQASYSYNQPQDIIFKIDQELTGTIFFRNEFWDNRDYGNEFTQRVRLELESTVEKSAKELMNVALGFRQLVSIFIGQQVGMKKIVMTSPSEKIELIDPSPGREMPLKDILVYFKPGQRLAPLPEHPLYFVAYSDIASGFQEIVRNWYQLLSTELKPIIFILLDALTDHSTFEEMDFLRAWQGAEAFHRIVLQDTRALKQAFNPKLEQIKEALAFDEELKALAQAALAFSYEPVAKERLRSLIRQNQHLLPASVTEEMITAWAREMGNTRNYLTHFDPKEHKKKISGPRLYQYTTLLKWLLVVLILRRLGVSEALLKNLSKHQHLYLSSLLSQRASVD